MKPNLTRIIQKSRALKTVICCLVCLTLLFNLPVSRPASAAPAVALVPVAVEGIGALLALLGVAVATGADTYALTQNYPYINSIFNGAGNTLESWYSVLPENVYYTDGNGNYYVGNSTDVPLVSASQLLFKASAVADAPSFFPSNVIGLSPRVALGSSNSWKYNTNMTALRQQYGDNVWLTPYCVTSDDRILVCSRSWRLGYSEGEYYEYTQLDPVPLPCPNYTSFTPSPGKVLYAAPTYYTEGRFGTNYNINEYGQISWYSGGEPVGTGVYPQTSHYYDYLGNIVSVGDGIWYKNKMAAFLISNEPPELGLDIDKSKLGDVVISVGGTSMPPANFDPDDPEDNDPQSSGAALIPPSMWEVFATIADFLGKTDLNNTNNSTTLGDFINNNYNYNNVDVDVNVPDSFHIIFETPLQLDIDADINLGGGIKLDITINEDVSLPSVSEGDGSGFFNADAVDALSALTIQNPIIGVLQGLFSVIDPALLGIFSTSVSLLIVLGLWKLIRG